MSLRIPFRLALAIGALLVIAGCSGQSGSSLFPPLSPPPEETPPAPEADAAPACKGAENCAAVLKKLVANPKRDWVGLRQPPHAYSDGTRLFAYRALKRKFTCAELTRAFEETRDVAPTMQDGSHAATRKLMTQVSGELRSERLQRCKPKAKS